MADDITITINHKSLDKVENFDCQGLFLTAITEGQTISAIIGEVTVEDLFMMGCRANEGVAHVLADGDDEALKDICRKQIAYIRRVMTGDIKEPRFEDRIDNSKGEEH